MFIVLIGSPGSGKGTQCKRLAEYLAVPHISTGEMLREMAAQGDPEVNDLVRLIRRGELVPDERIMDLIKRRLTLPDCAHGGLLDGVPRTIRQAELLDQFLASIRRRVAAAIEIRVPDAELLHRLRSRSESEDRSDDTAVTIQKRMEVYKASTMPLLNYYCDRSLLVTVDGVGSPDEIFDRICAGLPQPV